MERKNAENAQGKKQPAGLEISGLMREEFVAEIALDAEAGVFVTVKYISREELLALRKKATVKVPDAKTRQMVDQVDPAKADLLLARATVRGWRGLKVGGEEFPYTPENAEMLVKKWTRFAKFLNDVCDDLDEFAQAEREADGKK